jgi:hypothetical protein
MDGGLFQISSLQDRMYRLKVLNERRQKSTAKCVSNLKDESKLDLKQKPGHVSFNAIRFKITNTNLYESGVINQLHTKAAFRIFML